MIWNMAYEFSMVLSFSSILHYFAANKIKTISLVLTEIPYALLTLTSSFANGWKKVHACWTFFQLTKWSKNIWSWATTHTVKTTLFKGTWYKFQCNIRYWFFITPMYAKFPQWPAGESKLPHCWKKLFHTTLC